MADGSAFQAPAAPLTPPLKWAGGKRWLVNRLAVAVSVPFSRLIEPFAGSAAAFFRLMPNRAILADSNSELINVYKCIRSDYERIEKALSSHAHLHSDQYYYRVRSEIPRESFSRAARTLYLNRTCWNALYRVNRNGEFNVPRGTKNTVLLPTDDFRAVAAALQRASLRTSDFAATIREAGHGDLIFADPPYLSRTPNGTFIKYTNPVFRWRDQERLAGALIRAKERGAHFVVTNADCEELAKLYGRTGHLLRISRQSVISGPSKGRKLTSELLWTSFPLAIQLLRGEVRGCLCDDALAKR